MSRAAVFAVSDEASGPTGTMLNLAMGALDDYNFGCRAAGSAQAGGGIEPSPKDERRNCQSGI